ncbi:MAG: hypothetical protein MUD01_22665 [Chloroflexaceae bacterium]|jgi:hypothetical protein|nr:hypothetical protein [Chloroflexaceae bacterium]
MRPRTHLLTSALLALACYPRSPRKAALLTAGGVLLDLDHLLMYGLRTGDWSVTGALTYNRYRNKPVRRGDTRPRYGSLRSWLHNPLLLLAYAALAWRIQSTRPVALGLTLHLLLDSLPLPWYWLALARTRQCAWCGQQARLKIRHLSDEEGLHNINQRFVLVCERCLKQPLPM